MLRPFLCAVCLLLPVVAQPSPLLRLRFDGPVGDGLTRNDGAFNPSLVPLVGHEEDCVPPNPSAGALRGAGGPMSGIATGFPTWTLGASSWTVGFCIDTSGVQPANQFQYVFGDQFTEWRIFAGGSAGADGLVMAAGESTGFQRVVARGAAGRQGWTHVVFAFDALAVGGPRVQTFVNGVLDLSVPQASFIGLGQSGMSTLRVAAWPGSPATLAPGACMEDFRLYNFALPATDIATWYSQCIAATFQRNNPSATLRLDGRSLNGPFEPLSVVKCPGALVEIELDGALGRPFLFALDYGAPVPDRNPAPALGGDLINLNLQSPNLSFLDGGMLQPLARITWNHPFLFPVQVSGQLAVFDPVVPAGVRTSAAATIIPAAGGMGATPGPVSEDGFVEVILAAPGLCGPPEVSFYGARYDRMFVASNGRVTFGEGDGRFDPDVSAATTGPAFIGAWADFSPPVAGSIAVVRTASGLEVQYAGLPYFGDRLASAVSSFRIGYDEASAAWTLDGLSGLMPDPTRAPSSMFLGLSPGRSVAAGMATDPGPSSFHQGSAMAPALASDMIYEFGLAGSLLQNPGPIAAVEAITFIPVGANYRWMSR